MTKKTDVFEDSEKIQVLWHDMKKFPTISNLYLRALDEKEYGELPKEAAKAIQTILAAAITDMVQIENAYMLHRIETGCLSKRQSQEQMSTTIKSVLKFFSPFFKQNRRTVRNHVQTDIRFFTEASHGRNIITNMILLAHFLGDDSSDIYLEEKNGTLHLQVITAETKTSLIKKLDQDQIFAPKTEAHHIIPLLGYTTAKLAELSGHAFRITVKKHSLSLLYGKKEDLVH